MNTQYNKRWYNKLARSTMAASPLHQAVAGYFYFLSTTQFLIPRSLCTPSQFQRLLAAG